MHIVLEELRNAGFIGFILLFFGAIGIVLAIAALATLGARGRAPALLGAASMVLGALIAFGGMAGVYIGRAQTDAAISGASVTPILRERIRRVGYAESRSAARLGLVFSLPAILGGAIALLVAASRRRQAPAGSAGSSSPADMAWPGPAAAGGAWPASPPLTAGAPPQPASPPDAPAVSAALAAVMLGVAGLSVVGAIAPLLEPLPGRDLADDDPTWRLLEATDNVLHSDQALSGIDDEDLEDTARLARRCDELADVIAPAVRSDSVDTAKAPDLPEAAARCVEAEIARALAEPPEERRAALTALLRSPLLLDPAQKARIEAEIARTPEAAPSEAIGLRELGAPGEQPGSETQQGSGTQQGSSKVRDGASTVAGRLPREVIRRIVRKSMGRFRLCYEQGLTKNPALKGRVSVRFVIGRDGAVASAADGGSDLPDQAVVSCVVRTFKSLRFPQPEGGIVTVSYPIVFSPG